MFFKFKFILKIFLELNNIQKKPHTPIEEINITSSKELGLKLKSPIPSGKIFIIFVQI